MKNKLFKILCIASVSMLVLTGCKSVIPNILTEQNSEVLSEKISAAVEDQSQETFETELSTEEQSSKQKDEITAEQIVMEQELNPQEDEFDEDEQDIDFGLQDLRLASEEKD